VTRTTTITQSTSPLAWSSSGLPAGLLDRSQIGAAGGVAGLDGTGKVPTGQVPDLSGDYVPLSAKQPWGPLVVATGDSKLAQNSDQPNNVEGDSWLTYLWLTSNGDLDNPVNAGHGGYSSTQLAALFDSEVIAASPNVVMEDMGTNDTDATGATTVGNLATLLAKCKAVGAPLIVTTLMPAGTAGLNTVTPTLSAPALTQQSTGGTLGTGTVNYRVSAVNGVGETQAGNGQSTTFASGSTNSVLIEAPYVAGVTGYRFYKSTDGGTTWGLIGSTAATGGNSRPLRTFTDTGIALGAAPSGTDNTAVALTATTRAKILGINAAKKRFAHANGLIVLDFYAQVVDPVTGMWQTGLTPDGTHPAPQASKILGQYAWTQLKPYFRRRAPIGSLDQSDPYNYFPGSGTSVPNPNGVNSNGMMQTGSSAAPQGWVPSAVPNSGFTTARAARTGHGGSAYTLTRTTAGYVIGQGPWFTVTPGHKYAVRFKSELVGGDANGSTISVGAKWHNNSGAPNYLAEAAVSSDYGPFVAQAIGVAPAGATQLEIMVDLLGEGTAALSEVFVYDLTAMGLS
jgi:hypothetical protein